MAALPHNNTAIYYFDYTESGREHTAEMRFDGGVSPAAAGAQFTGMLIDCLTLLRAMTLLTVRHQVSGSNVAFPVVTGYEGTTYGSGAGTVDNAPQYMDFVGRSSGGRRVRLAIFGYKGPISTWRLTSAESAPINTAVARLNAAAGMFLAIDGIKPLWYPYVNVGYNAYWQRKVRA